MPDYRKYALAAAAIALLAGCEVYTDGSPFATGSATSQSNAQASTTNPVVLGIAPNPSAIANAGDTITFTLTSVDPGRSVDDYTWTATRGTLSATKGQLVTWSPRNPDGTLTPGVATVQVMLSNAGGGSTVAAVNLTINASGAAAVAAPTPAPSPTPTPSATPTPTPSATPTPAHWDSH